MRQLSDTAESWEVVRSEDLHRDGWVVALRADWIQRPSSDLDPAGEPEEPFRRLVLEHPGAAVVLAVDDQRRVLVLKQYRHPAQCRFVELPAGLLDEVGEDPEQAARRELREEAGFEAERWTRIGSTYGSPGISSEVMHAFLATGLREVGRGDFALVHEEADMEVAWVHLDDLMAAILDGRVQDAPVVTSVLLAHGKGLLDASGV